MKKRGHQFDWRFEKWQVCSKCGLVALSNDATRKELRKPCSGAESGD